MDTFGGQGIAMSTIENHLLGNVEEGISIFFRFYLLSPWGDNTYGKCINTYIDDTENRDTSILFKMKFLQCIAAKWAEKNTKYAANAFDALNDFKTYKLVNNYLQLSCAISKYK